MVLDPSNSSVILNRKWLPVISKNNLMDLFKGIIW